MRAMRDYYKNLIHQPKNIENMDNMLSLTDLSRKGDLMVEHLGTKYKVAILVIQVY
jgi:hypothetical protein